MPSAASAPRVAPDQENVPPPRGLSTSGVTARVRSAAIYAVAGQINGSAKDSNKRRLGPRLDDPEKIELFFRKMDGAGSLFNLADDAKRYLESIVNAGNTNIPPNSLGPAIDVLLSLKSTKEGLRCSRPPTVSAEQSNANCSTLAPRSKLDGHHMLPDVPRPCCLIPPHQQLCPACRVVRLCRLLLLLAQEVRMLLARRTPSFDQRL